MKEIYKPLEAIHSPRINGELSVKGYEISNKGNLRLVNSKGVIAAQKWDTSTDPRPRFKFKMKNRATAWAFAHRLVAQEFLEGYEPSAKVRPKDGNYQHLTVDNLEIF